MARAFATTGDASREYSANLLQTECECNGEKKRRSPHGSSSRPLTQTARPRRPTASLRAVSQDSEVDSHSAATCAVAMRAGTCATTLLCGAFEPRTAEQAVPATLPTAHSTLCGHFWRLPGTRVLTVHPDHASAMHESSAGSVNRATPPPGLCRRDRDAKKTNPSTWHSHELCCHLLPKHKMRRQGLPNVRPHPGLPARHSAVPLPRWGEVPKNAHSANIGGVPGVPHAPVHPSRPSAARKCVLQAPFMRGQKKKGARTAPLRDLQVRLHPPWLAMSRDVGERSGSSWARSFLCTFSGHRNT